MELKRKRIGLPAWLMCCLAAGMLFSCGERKGNVVYHEADSLNVVAYRMRYKNLDTTFAAAQRAYRLSEAFPSLRAEAMNNLGFCAFMRMDFDGADEWFRRVYAVSDNELECLIADIGQMKICQRTARNKEFYDYRYSALNRMQRIDDDRSAITGAKEQARLAYARSEFAIVSATYYYYLQQEEQALEAINALKVDETLENDTAQFLYYKYMKGSGGLYQADTPQDVVLGEFDFLADCLVLGRKGGYLYFEANASQALAELLNDRKAYDLLMESRPVAMRALNTSDLPWEALTLQFAAHALDLFRQYGDWYQISGTYRTLASCSNEQGRYEDALDYLTNALDYVNLHHETYYPCTDSVDRLVPYVPMDTTSVELEWINSGHIRTVPEWIARLREQLSVTYAALGMKPRSDYNRNIYLDILDYTRQDKELESRYAALERESKARTGLLALVIAGIGLLVLLLMFLNRRWRMRNAFYIDKLEQTLEICRKITSSVPADAGDVADVTASIVASVRTDVLRLFAATEFYIVPEGEPTGEKPPATEGVCTRYALTLPGREQPVGELFLYTPHRLEKDDRALVQVISPYLAWTLANGLTFLSLGAERKRLEKEQYVHAQHVAANKRQNLVKKACLFLVTDIRPYIDRIANEVQKLLERRPAYDTETKEGKYRYIGELIARINEYNDILALWIQMRQGTLSLNIEHFELNPLFDVLVKGRKTFEMKRQVLTVKPTDAVVKADKALTLFMINTLAENARKYTQTGGHITVSAQETECYVEISVADDGPGLSPEDVACIVGEKVYDSGKIGMQTSENVEELRKNKGHGFGLMNCKGIIEKYRKTNDLFRVCRFDVESRPGAGSRFYFRLPKGVRKALVWVGLVCLPFWAGCSGNTSARQADEEPVATDSVRRYDKWLAEADKYAYEVYLCNVNGFYSEALCYVDSAFDCLNTHYRMYAGSDTPLLALEGEGTSAERDWFSLRFDTDYYMLLDLRNEAAVAYLALGNLAAYRYNNDAYTTLYKQISEDTLLEQYCSRMQLSAGNKTVAIALCLLLLVVFLTGYYLLYFRHRLMYRYNLEQVLEINRQVFSASVQNRADDDIAAALVREIYGGVNELLPIDTLALAVWHEERNDLTYTFFPGGEETMELRKAMTRCFEGKTARWTESDGIRCLPLWVETGNGRLCTGVIAVKATQPVGREDDRLMWELVAGYVAIRVYHAVVLLAQKYGRIEHARDEANRALREANQLHVQNLVLDNCLSTIKHETIYYPNRIRQIIDKLDARQTDAGEERAQLETIGELIGYYKDIFTLLSSCAARQLEEITFRRGTVQARELADHAVRYLKRVGNRLPFRVVLEAEAEDVAIGGDLIQLKFLLENLVDEALAHEADGRLVLRIRRDGDFVRFDWEDTRRKKTREELDQLFYPHLSRMKPGREGSLAGTEYLVCKQIIRDHDEYMGRRGCRINARPGDAGGFGVWFTVPAK